MFQTRVNIRPNRSPETISFETGLTRVLSGVDAFGIEVTDIPNMEGLYQLYRAQGAFLLENTGTEAPDAEWALRQLDDPHIRESGLRATEDAVGVTPLAARVLVPYAPQYGYRQKQEIELGKPLRLSLGVYRPTQGGSKPVFNVARTTLWVCTDRRTAGYPDMVRKDVAKPRTNLNAEDLERFLTNPQRAEARTTFVTQQLALRTDRN